MRYCFNCGKELGFYSDYDPRKKTHGVGLMNKDSLKTHSIGPHLLVAPPTIPLVTARSNLHPPATLSL